jgi:type VI secretion system secreted protein Hcp
VGWTDIDTLQWGVIRFMNTVAGAAANREGAEPLVGEVILTKTSDSSTVKLFSMATSGNSGVTARIHQVTIGNPSDTYLELTLSNTLVTAYMIRAENDRPKEKIVLNFTKIEMKYVQYESQNTPIPPVIASYDLATTKFS